ncbi:CD225/dispanin family protein [Spirillospora albida]|uniref:CD225/dispanin family protein n=1 Tax=Spirillospora albida TaxID=58123 RepID=UPI0004BF8935|nr:CD225/dispanin family protein [Spirillospora albida]
MSYYPPPQHGGPGGYPSAPPPPNNLVWAILTTLFCCLPAGVVSIVFAAQVNSKWQSGDHAGAISASKNAKTWAIVSAVVGLLGIGVYVVIAVVAASSGNS